MKKKVILSLMFTLICLDCSASAENSKLKMALIGGSTVAALGTIAYKSFGYYQSKSASKAVAEVSKETAEAGVVNTDVPAASADSVSDISVGAADAKELSAKNDLGQLLHAVAEGVQENYGTIMVTQILAQNNADRLDALELSTINVSKKNSSPVSSNGSLTGTIKRSSSLSGAAAHAEPLDGSMIIG